MVPGDEGDCAGEPGALYQIVCISCGYRRAWPTLVEAHADGHRHHAEHAASLATRALPAPQSEVQRPGSIRERCPQCRGTDILPLGRVLADSTGRIRSTYRCRGCAREFMLPHNERRVGPRDRRANPERRVGPERRLGPHDRRASS
jgi:hypothetical protein